MTLAALTGRASAESLPLLAVASVRSIAEFRTSAPAPRPTAAPEAPAPSLDEPVLPWLTTSVSAKEATDPRSLVGEGERTRLMELAASARWRLLEAKVTKDQSAVGAAVAIPDWPVLEITYAAGDATRVRLTPQGRDGDASRHDFDSITGAASYHGGPAWDVAASTTLSQSQGVTRAQEETASVSQDMALTLRLLDSLTAMPAVTLTQERSVSAPDAETGTARLMLAYAPPASPWSASTYAGYTATRTSDRAVDARSLTLTAAMTYALNAWLPGRASLSGEVGYDRYADVATRESASHAVSGFLLLRIAGF